MKNTLIVNIFGLSECGRTTCAAYIFAQLKMVGIDCEYVSGCFEGDCENEPLYVMGCQSHMCNRLMGMVDVIVNDSPILTGCMLTDRRWLQNAIVEDFLSYGDNNINLLFVSDDENFKEQTDVLKQLFRFDWFGLGDEHQPITSIEVPCGIDGCNSALELILKVLQYTKTDETLTES